MPRHASARYPDRAATGVSTPRGQSPSTAMELVD